MKIDFKLREVKNADQFAGLKIWEKPKQMAQYAIGADVAEGIGSDASCAQVINCTTGLLVANFWSNTLDLDNYATELFKLGTYYNKAALCIESNNHGHGIIALLGGSSGGLCYQNLYRRLVLDEYTQKRTKQIGFKTTSSTKPRIIENLKAALRDGDLLVHCKNTIRELGNFVVDEKTGRLGARGSNKDDRVMALALAWEQARLIRENSRITEDSYMPAQTFDPSTGFPMIG